MITTFHELLAVSSVKYQMTAHTTPLQNHLGYITFHNNAPFCRHHHTTSAVL